VAIQSSTSLAAEPPGQARRYRLRNGKIGGGHFYLASHGKFTEVSEAVYAYSLWHARSLFVTHPLAMLTGYLAKLEQKARKLSA
jgi:hypothetical protein